ncbi:MAG: Txe/YoeB family addiction module toxin [Acidaminococcaceae bacterium]|jgi:toxin YoeB|nr:Txe/YoeB family addiction module toxin [Acidaminococcaceae bacterium]MBQ7417939.1 Txe/YoeB family addiction module toxin [Acidaminococcaceae bacterium]
MSEKVWSDEAWDDYLYWQAQDKKILRRINTLIKDIERNGPLTGIGDPEALKGDFQGYFSRRINAKDRLVYKIENGSRLFIAQCRGHYDDK